MTRTLLSLAAGLAAATLVVAAPVKKEDASPHINLKDHINVKLEENLHSDRYPDNNLKSLPEGKKKYAEVTFDIGKGILQLGSSQIPDKPKKFEGIKVAQPAKKLHFLQATGYSTDADTVIAKYIINYEDKTTAEIEVAYGRDVVDWWSYPDQTAPTKGKLAWEGENPAAKGFDAKIKLYLMTWDNPKPDKQIATIDFIAANPDQPAAPFCAAITVEK